MLAFVAAGMLVGSTYWNDQLSFGLTLPAGYAYCPSWTGGTPDRGVDVLLDKKQTCPSPAEMGGTMYDYVAKRKLPDLYVVAEYNVPEEFKDVRQLARANCAMDASNEGIKRHTSIPLFERTIHGRKMIFCNAGTHRETIRGFVQLKGAVNIEIGLRNTYRQHIAEYWRSVKTFTEHAPK